MRKLFCFKEEPVSVTSTIASTNSGTFTSVAPHENSIFALIPFSFSHFSTNPTPSVAIDFPSKSSTFLISESFGTARTHLTGFFDCFE